MTYDDLPCARASSLVSVELRSAQASPSVFLFFKMWFPIASTALAIVLYEEFSACDVFQVFSQRFLESQPAYQWWFR